jgi:SAM-dependent methyltransferase
MIETGRAESGACWVCGGLTFNHAPVLWPELVATWGLSPEEAAYVDVQQGTRCAACGANVRSIALARAILHWCQSEGPLSHFVTDQRARGLRVLEINEAGTLNPWLRQLPGHVLASYPEHDMTCLSFPASAFDLVVHSDTLEHIADPIAALRECRRVLDPGGALIFTVPTIVGRLSRGRAGLPASYHGQSGLEDPLMEVRTEFGADVWTYVMRAGFSACELVEFRFPAGIAVVARRQA